MIKKLYSGGAVPKERQIFIKRSQFCAISAMIKSSATCMCCAEEKSANSGLSGQYE